MYRTFSVDKRAVAPKYGVSHSVVVAQGSYKAATLKHRLEQVMATGPPNTASG